MIDHKRRPGWLGIAVAAGVIVGVSASCSNSTPEPVEIQLVNIPAFVTVGQSVPLTASVVNDATEAGVDWSGGGSFSPVHTASGAVTTFTAPASPGPATVTVKASVDPTVSASRTITVVPAEGNARLNGAYVFSVGGADSSGSYAAVGLIVADGAGRITSGRQDLANLSVYSGPDPVTGVYAIGPDGRGSISLVVENAIFPQGGVETFGIALASNSHALIIQFDGIATSSGTLDAQAADAVDPAALSGPYAFTAQGVDIVNAVPLTHGGILHMNVVSGSIGGGAYYENDGGATYSASTTGTVTVPSEFGRGTIALDIGVNFIYYAVRGQVLRILGTDVPGTMTSGSMIGQGAAGVSDTFSDASLTGAYVITEAGGSGYGPLALAGQFTSNGAGDFTAGSTDLNHAGVVTFAPIDGTSRYSIGANGAGFVDLPPLVDQRNSVQFLVVFAVSPDINLFDPALTTGGGGALVMDWDPGAVGTGVIAPQSIEPLDGDYAFNDQFIGGAGENDWIGRVTAAAGALAGTVDINASAVTDVGRALTGTWVQDPFRPGRLTGSITVGGVAHGLTYFQIGGGLVLAVDTDPADIGIVFLDKM